MSDDITGGDIQAAEQAASGSSPEPTTSPESTPAVSASADTTVPPAAPTPGEASPSTAGVPPEHRWPAILESQRKEAAAKAVAELEQQIGWAKQIDQREFQSVRQLAQRATTDPIGYMQEFIKELQAHPTYSAQLKSLAAKALAQRGTSPAAAPDLNPIQVQLENGQTLGMYSSDQISALRQQWLDEVRQEMAPLRQSHQQAESARLAVERQQEIDSYVSTTFEDLKAWPGMQSVENQQAVGRYLLEHPSRTDDPRDVTLAAIAAVRAVVLPTLQRTERQAVLNDLNARANASTVNPARTSTNAPKTMADMSIAEALAHVAAQSA